MHTFTVIVSNTAWTIVGRCGRNVPIQRNLHCLTSTTYDLFCGILEGFIDRGDDVSNICMLIDYGFEPGHIVQKFALQIWISVRIYVIEVANKVMKEPTKLFVCRNNRSVPYFETLPPMHSSLKL